MFPMIVHSGGDGGGSSAPAPPAPSPTPPSPSPTPPDPAPSPTQPTGDAIPKARFDEVNERAKTAEKEAAEAKARLQEIEDAQKSEADRAKSQAEREKTRADAAEAALATERRNGLVRAFASAASFADPDDAILLLASADLDVEKPDKIKEAVDALIEAKPHLRGNGATPPPPTPFGMPGGGLPNGVPASVPLDEHGKPDQKAALGSGLLGALAKSGFVRQ